MSELIERLRDENYAGEMQHLRSWSEIDSLFRQAADALETKDALIAKLAKALQLLADDARENEK